MGQSARVLRVEYGHGWYWWTDLVWCGEEQRRTSIPVKPHYTFVPTLSALIHILYYMRVLRTTHCTFFMNPQRVSFQDCRADIDT